MLVLGECWSLYLNSISEDEEVWLMHKADTQCTVEEREEAKGQRKKKIMFKLCLSSIRYEFYFKINSANLGVQNVASILTALWIELPNSSKASCLTEFGILW